MSRLHSITSLLSHPTAVNLAILAGIAVVGLGLLLVAGRTSPTTLIALGTGAEIFSGNWRNMHIPIPIDRALLILGLVSIVVGGKRWFTDRSLALRPVHLLILMVAAWATGSAIWADTIAQHGGFYALLDRLGYIPFLGFTLAPLLFGTPGRRRFLLGLLVVVGAYLGITGVMEGVGLVRYVEPSYIRNPDIGILFGRARGPFTESAADGLSMFMCAVAAGVGLSVWKQWRIRLVCGGVMVVCGLGIIFTLTRAVWIGAAAATIVALVAAPATRRYAVALIAGGAIVIGLTLAVVPGLSSKVSSRATAQSSVYDRLNTNAAALRAVEQHPVFGLGWQTFATKGPSYLRQAATYPLTGAGLEVHNVFLSHAVELGLPGSILWTVALLGAVGGAIVRRGPPELMPWRIAMLAMVVCFLVVANLGPLSYAFPNLLLWTWAGIVSVEYLSTRRPVPEPQAFELMEPAVPVAIAAS